MTPTSEFVIETEGLTRYFGTSKVVDSVNLRVPRGSVFGFLGRSGSGKTTTIRLLLGLLRPTRGVARVFGEESTALRPMTRARIGYVSESHALYEWMTVAEQGYYQSRFYRTWDSGVFGQIIRHFGLDLDAKSGSLSRGQRAGLSLALALAIDPELLILDDPGIGLDIRARRALLDSILALSRASHRTVFFSSHQLEDIETVSTHVGILDRSVLRVQCEVDDVTANTRGFALAFEGTPPALPKIPGLLTAQVSGQWWRLILVRPGDEARRVLHSLGAATVDEHSVTLRDALAGYLGEKIERRANVEFVTPAGVA